MSAIQLDSKSPFSRLQGGNISFSGQHLLNTGVYNTVCVFNKEEVGHEYV